MICGARPVLPREVEERLVPVAELPLLALRASELDGAGHEHRLKRRELRRRGRDGEQRPRAIRRAAVEQVVVHLHHDLASCRKRDPGALREAVPAPTRRPRGDPVRVVERVGDPRSVACRKPRPAEARPARAGVAAVESLGIRELGRTDLEEDHVVHDLRLTGDDPCRCHERVARLLGVEQEAAVVVGDPLRRRRRVCRLHLQVEERLALTHLRALLCRRLASGAVDLPAGSCPREDRRALLRAQDPAALPDVFRRALPRRPRRHDVRLHDCRDGGGARRDLPGGDE